MKNILLIVIIGLCTVRFASAQTYTDVLITTAKNMIDTNSSLVILDVRNQTEYDAGHVRNARLIPLYELQGRLGELNKTDEILIYCKAGGRSTAASQTLVDNSFLHVYNMLGGFEAWNKTGYPYYVKYSSIQEAINGASEGTKILVSSGLYHEHIQVNKSLIIIGENKYKTIIDGSGSGTVFQVKADNVSISETSVQFCGCSCEDFRGIYVEPHHQNVNITDNNIVSNGIGIEISWGNGAILARNNITQSSYAIRASNSSNILIQNNSITLNSDGADLLNSTNINVSANTIYDNAYGLYIARSGNNSIINNLFDSNQIYDIFDGGQCANNSIFHNNFVLSISYPFTPDSANSWDDGYPSGGNYWSNYTDVDLYSGSHQNETGSDGIWDHPYHRTGGTDRYPLKGSFNTTSIIAWNETVYNVDVVSNSEISNFSYSANPQTLGLEVGARAAGFCRVAIPKDLMSAEGTEQWIITQDGEPIQQRNVRGDDYYNYIYFNYTQGTRTVLIQKEKAIPEFSLYPILPLSVATTLLLLVAYRKRLVTTHKKPV